MADITTKDRLRPVPNARTIKFSFTCDLFTELYPDIKFYSIYEYAIECTAQNVGFKLSIFSFGEKKLAYATDIALSLS